MGKKKFKFKLFDKVRMLQPAYYRKYTYQVVYRGINQRGEIKYKVALITKVQGELVLFNGMIPEKDLEPVDNGVSKAIKRIKNVKSKTKPKKSA